MRLSRRRKANSAEDRREQLRHARTSAPTLRDSSSAAEQVWVELVFDAHSHLAPAPHVFTVFPPAQAHFVYACPFGDCDGTYDLNEQVFGLLRTRMCQTKGVLVCSGHRSSGGASGSPCGQGVAYAVSVRYGAEEPASSAEAPAARRTGPK